MNVKIQILSMIISFLYGILIFVTNKVNRKLNSSSFILKLLIDTLYVFIIVILYIIIMYKVNNGIFHIYFIILMLIGYVLMSNVVKFLNNRLKIYKNKCK